VHTSLDTQARAYAQRALDIEAARTARLERSGITPSGKSAGSIGDAACSGIRGPQFGIGMFDNRGEAWPEIASSRGYNG
jgi:hypothetical protein